MKNLTGENSNNNVFCPCFSIVDFKQVFVHMEQLVEKDRSYTWVYLIDFADVVLLPFLSTF